MVIPEDPCTYDGNDIVFPSGDRQYCYGGIAGLERWGEGEWSLGYGSDGGLDVGEIRPSDRVAIAEYYIALWTAFRDEAAAIEDQ